MIYQARNGISLGANESFLPQHQVSADTDLALGRLSTVLEWKSEEYRNYKKVTNRSFVYNITLIRLFLWNWRLMYVLFMI